MAQFEHENRAEEDRCLANIKQMLQGVGAVIVEPISSHENQLATPYFFRQLRRLCTAEGVQFIVDETKTGMGASGKNWAHEYWYLHEAPDFVTFGGKSGLGGFYSTREQRMNDEGVSFSQNLDMKKVLNYGKTWEIVADQNLLQLQKDTSSFLKIELDRIGRETGIIDGQVRGYGTHLGFDCHTEAQANSL